MGPKKVDALLERAGRHLMLVGVASIAGIFLIVLVNGTWPEFLIPVKDRASLIADLVGDFVIVVWGLVFVGPGFLVQSLGQWLQRD